ncbi:MAG: TAXI family TRAP transporter solute-binding subunit [Halarsenatibacteraceae bacterium]
MRREFKYLLFLVLAFALIFSGPVAAQEYISIATGGTAGTYYPLGGGMAELINENVDDVDATAEVTGASVENVRLVQNGEVEFALVQNDISYYAKNGEEMFDGDPLDNLRGVALLYPEDIQIVTLEENDIKTVSDFEGKRVAVGAPGSGTEANARQIIEAHGLTYDDISIDYLSFSEAVDQLKDGHVEAAFITAGAPTSAIIDLAATEDVKILDVEGDALEQIQEDYPYYITKVIPGGTYSGIDEDINTVAVSAMLITNEAADEDMVYNVTRAIFDNLDELGEIHDRGKDVTVEGALEGMPIDLHLGAERYFE